MSAPLRVWIVSADAEMRQRVERALGLSGFGLRALAPEEFEAKDSPDLLILDLRGADAESRALRLLGHHAARPHSRVLALVDHAREAHAAMSAGADEIVLLPLDAEELELRVQLQLELVRQFSEAERREHDMGVVLELVQLLAGARDVREALCTWVERIAEMAHADRVSIVVTRPGTRRAYVIASSDDPELRDLPISLDAHPEIAECVNNQAPVFVGDALRDERFDTLTPEHDFEFRSMLVVPLRDEAMPQAQGVLFVRARRPASLDVALLPLLQTLGFVAGVAIRNARVMQSLRAESQHSTEARLQAEKRMRRLRPYAEFFKNSADGMAVMEPDGRLLYANPLARRMAGRTTRLEGANVIDFLDPRERERAIAVAKGFRAGIYPKGIDFRVDSPSGPVTLNVNFSETSIGAGAVLLTFRDVTRERETEQELIQTKGFLERVIDSSVDAIVSSDLTGKVRVFNRAAARIFGYDPEDVVDKMNVERLYPPGGARNIMRAIRSTEHGGRGRIEGRQVNMLDSSGRLIPVKISAALIYQNGKPVGSVGVFQDIREQLRMQANLRQAQDEIREHERNTAVAQLAGATAHELNQPLTNVIIQAEWLRRHLADDPRMIAATDVLVGQAERMADIVKRIGRITKYETRTYVGGAKILDLDKSSALPDASAAPAPEEAESDAQAPTPPGQPRGA